MKGMKGNERETMARFARQITFLRKSVVNILLRCRTPPNPPSSPLSSTRPKAATVTTQLSARPGSGRDFLEEKAGLFAMPGGGEPVAQRFLRGVRADVEHRATEL